MHLPLGSLSRTLLLCFVFVFGLAPKGLLAQGITERQPEFGQASPALDVHDFPRLITTDKGYLTVSKAKGRHGTKATYYVQEWNKELYLEFQHEYNFESDEQPIGLYLTEDGARYGLLVHTWSLRKKNSSVVAYEAKRQVGAEREMRGLAEYGVASWRSSPSKGQVAARLEGVTRSGIGHEPPLGYQVWVRYSPNRDYFLVYHYEFGKPGLLVNVDLFDRNGEKIAAGQLPVNRGRISYDLYLNNRGEVLFLETTPTGGVSMVRYDLETRESVFLEISSSNYLRTQFQVHLLSDDEVYIANEAEKDGELEGVMFAHFNFADHEVQDITFWRISRGLRNQYDTTLAAAGRNKADWRGIDLVDFRIDEKGQRWFTLEKRAYSAPGFSYDHTAVLEPELWFDRNGTVAIGDAFVLAFNDKNEYIGGNILLKSTSSSADNGLRTVGVEVSTDEDQIVVVHHNEGIAGGEVQISTWHPGDANWQHAPLNPGGIFTRIRDYTVFTPEGILMAGFTHPFGKESELILFTR